MMVEMQNTDSGAEAGTGSLPHSWSNASFHGKDDEISLLWHDQQRTSARRGGGAVGYSDPPGTDQAAAPNSPLTSFRASWPSIHEHFMYYFRPGVDWYLFCAGTIYLFSRAPTPEQARSGDGSWALFRGNPFLFFWLPFLARIIPRFLHSLLSLLVLPGQVLYNEGPCTKYYPKKIQVHTYALRRARPVLTTRLTVDRAFV